MGIDCGEKKDRVLDAGLPPIGADMGGRKLPFGLVGRKGGVPWYAPGLKFSDGILGDATEAPFTSSAQ